MDRVHSSLDLFLASALCSWLSLVLCSNGFIYMNLLSSVERRARIPQLLHVWIFTSLIPTFPSLESLDNLFLWHLHSWWIKLSGSIGMGDQEKGEMEFILISTANSSIFWGPQIAENSLIPLAVFLCMLITMKCKNSSFQKSVNVSFNNIWGARKNEWEMESRDRPSCYYWHLRLMRQPKGLSVAKRDHSVPKVLWDTGKTIMHKYSSSFS